MVPLSSVYVSIARTEQRKHSTVAYYSRTQPQGANLLPGLATTAPTGTASLCVLPSGSSSSFSVSRHS
ncbi:hypothetical protein PIB30_054842, partial [Stylosanthes scabra]|nr:hypothetical protein [Stylosanthes scabra]